MTTTDPEARHVKDAASRSDSEQIIQALEAGKNKRVRKLLGRMHPAKVAAMLELLEAEQRLALCQQRFICTTAAQDASLCLKKSP